MTDFGGKVSSLLTNYDITFWLLLCSALDSGSRSEIEKRPCTALPFKKVAVRPLRPRVARTMAAINLLLVHSKVEDDRVDGEKVKAGIAIALLGKRFKAARDYLQDTDFQLNSILELPLAQSAAEQNPNPTFTTLCRPTEHALGEIFATIARLQEKPELESVLRDFGAELGGYLYLWDALTDRRADQKKGQFNAIDAAGPEAMAELRKELYCRIDTMRRTLDSLALGPEGGLCYGLLNSLRQRLISTLAPLPAARTPSPRRRLAKAGIVHAQDDCCEVDCCECGSCCDCNVCDCNPCDGGDHCCEFNCCDLSTLCCCMCDSGSRSRRSCMCDDCDFYCLESLCCGDSYHTSSANHSYTSTDSSHRAGPSLMDRFRSMTTSLTPAKETGPADRSCPCCDLSMVTLMVGSIQIEECRNCGGIWLDDQEIEVLARTGRLPHNLLNRYPVGEHSIQYLPGERSCPVCTESELVAVPYLGVPVEMCRGCHGFWLEHGTLRRVLKAKRSPKRLMKSHKKEWRCPYCEQVAKGGADICGNCGAPRPKSGFTGKLA